MNQISIVAYCAVFNLYLGTSTLIKIQWPWSPITGQKMSYVVNCVKHRFLHYTVIPVPSTCVRPASRYIYWMNLKNVSLCQSNREDSLLAILHVLIIQWEFVNFIVSIVIFPYVYFVFFSGTPIPWCNRYQKYFGKKEKCS